MLPTALTRAPSSTAVLGALHTLRDSLGRDVCYHHQGRYHFLLTGDYTLAVSADSEDRLRIETCHRASPGDTLWVLAGDKARLGAVAEGLAEKVAAAV